MATQEFVTLYADHEKFEQMMEKVEPLAAADGFAAVTYVRQHAAEWGVSPTESALLGFPPAELSQPKLPFVISRKGGRRLSPRSMAAYPKTLLFPEMRRHCLLPLPPMTNWDWRDKALCCMGSGQAHTNQRNCTCMRRAATASACGSRMFPRIIGSTASLTGFSGKA